MKKCILMVVLLGVSVTVALAGELQKKYFVATKPGTWAEYSLEAAGVKYSSSSQRNADENGHVVIEETVKVQTGPGSGTESKNTFVLPKDFNIADDLLSYGKFTEKMSMKAGSVEMPIDATTLAAIKKGAKDFRGAVSFEAVEKVDGHTCDRYAYTVAIAGPAPGKETGRLWLDATVPFGIVRQVATSFNADGSVASSFKLTLQETGQVQLEGIEAATPAAPAEKPAPPPVVSLIDGYKAGRIGIEVAAAQGSNGQPLQLVFINKTDTLLTVKLAAGALTIPASEPINSLRIVIKKAEDIAIPAGSASEALTVEQQPGRGPIEGKCELSVYEGTLLFSGSATLGTVIGK
jgi:hypothetical protein